MPAPLHPGPGLAGAGGWGWIAGGGLRQDVVGARCVVTGCTMIRGRRTARGAAARA